MKVSLIAFGGCGHNLMKAVLEAEVFQKAEKFQTDLVKTIDGLDGVKTYTYKTKAKDGCGRNRNAAVEPVKRELDSLAVACPPGDVVIMLHSLGGGSGNVQARYYGELAASQGKLVFSLGVGSKSNTKEITNTIGSLASLEKAVSDAGAPIIFCPFFNQNEAKRAEVNAQVIETLKMLELLFSGICKTPDESDLASWVNFHKITKAEPMLTSIVFLDGSAKSDDWAKVESIESVITLTTEESPAPLPILPAFDIWGQLPPKYILKAEGKLPQDQRLSFCLSVNHTAVFMAKMQEIQKADKASKTASVRRSSLAEGVDEDDVI